ncbi:T6A9.7 protein [Striga asiatica]|uniref:T6A9.7 protein n=1 Tax=Striga asiatica TaxID=4170 RepID=A0A5A7QC23_STRAF|nr:T6A9.7 protein [Striga asiatica]
MEVKVDIESGEARNESHTKTESNSGSKWGKKKTLNKLFGGVLGFNGLVGPTTKPNVICGSEVEYPKEPIQGPAPKVEIENKKGGKIKKAPKPPRAPGTPSLNAADIRLIKEISKIAMKKRERFERIKALKKMKAARLPLSSSSSSSSSCSTISAMVITILFFLLLIFQGIGGRTSSNVRPARESRGT